MMNTSLSSFLLHLALVSLLYMASLTCSQTPPAAPQQSPSAACKYTPYPKLCRTILSSIRSSPSDPYGYGKFSVKQCMKQAHRLSHALQRYLNRKKKAPISHEEDGALEDCYELSELNVDYLESISIELKSADSMTDELVERVETLLSGIVTNQQTCYDGLEDAKSSIVSALSGPLLDTTKLYSVSLGLVTQALSKNVKNKKKRSGNQFMSKGHPIREPLNTLIQTLQHGTCNTNASANCIKRKRALEEVKSNGILVNNVVTVGLNGTANFTSIGDAIDLAPNNTRPEDGYFVIYVQEGIYEEYVVVTKHKKNILMVGDGINRTIITGNHSFVDGWTTFNSSTFAVSGERFIAIDITFKNTAGPEKHQAVAVRNSADLSTFYRCSFEGYQDTLYAHSLRQFYRECDIYGTVDFIFGNSACVFQDCHLYARKPLTNQKNAFTAQGRTDPNQNTGISIQNCTIDAAPDLAMDLNSTLNYLGRPWKNYSRTVYMQSYIGELIDPVGWLEWNGTAGLDTVFYGEFENYGPRANTSQRVNWPGFNLMNATQALNFTVYNFTLGDTWLPNTDIPFNAGLLQQ